MKIKLFIILKLINIKFIFYQCFLIKSNEIKHLLNIERTLFPQTFFNFFAYKFAVNYYQNET